MVGLKRDDEEHRVPDSLRSFFVQIVDAFIQGDFLLREHQIDGVAPIESATAKAIEDNILAYGDGLAPLHASTWEHSCYRWMDGHWQVLVDLTTDGEAVSDLALHADLRDVPSPLLEIRAVHVP